MLQFSCRFTFLSTFRRG